MSGDKIKPLTRKDMTPSAKTKKRRRSQNPELNRPLLQVDSLPSIREEVNGPLALVASNVFDKSAEGKIEKMLGVNEAETTYG